MAGHVRLCYLLFLRFVTLNLHFEVVYTQICQHQIPKKHEIVHHVFLEPEHILKRRSIDQKLRIHLVFDATVNSLPLSEHIQLIKTRILLEALQYWQNTLSVRETIGPIRLQRQCNSNMLRYSSNTEDDSQPYCVDGCVENTKCGEVTVPPEHLEACREGGRPDLPGRIVGEPGDGISDADFILYVSALTTERCSLGTTVAYASYCQLELALDRPVSGYVNICPEAISTKEHEIQQMISTIKHEILHALGFSAGLFAFYRNEAGEPYTPRYRLGNKPEYNPDLNLYQWSDKVVKTVTRTDWETRSGLVSRKAHMIVTPRVVDEIRKHFNCSSLEGAELEDQGIVGTAFTHWEKRMFENEVMTGTYTQHPMVSRITLALMEDTGWYKADYSMAEPLLWGKSLGCDFVKKSCLTWMKLKKANKESVHPFCDRVKRDSLETECLESRDAVAICNLVKYEKPLPSKYQYFTEVYTVPKSDVTYYAGSVPLADYCPYLQEFNWKHGDTVARGSRCSIKENYPDQENNFALETYGSGTKCFKHAFPFKLKQCSVTHSVRHWGSGCYKYSCDSEVGLIIEVGSTQYRCYNAGQQIHIQEASTKWLHDGYIVCPSCEEICADKIICPAEQPVPAEAQSSYNPDIPCPANSANEINIPTLTYLLVILFFSIML